MIASILSKGSISFSNVNNETSRMIFILGLASFLRTITIIPKVYTQNHESFCQIVGFLHWYGFCTELTTTFFMVRLFTKSLYGPIHGHHPKVHCAVILLLPFIPGIIAFINQNFKDDYYVCIVNSSSAGGVALIVYMQFFLFLGIFEFGRLYYTMSKLSSDIMTLMKFKLLKGMGLYILSTLSIVLIPNIIALIIYCSTNTFHVSMFFTMMSSYLTSIMYAIIFYTMRHYSKQVREREKFIYYYPELIIIVLYKLCMYLYR
jgi:hypothetical protein